MNDPIENYLARVRIYLPQQAPLKNFVHHNTLSCFEAQDLSFYEALRSASTLYGSLQFLPLSNYRAQYAEGKISTTALSHCLSEVKENKEDLFEKMLQGSFEEGSDRTGFREQGYLREMLVQTELVIEEGVHPTVYRFVSSYLDQGIAQLGIFENTSSFWAALRAQVEAVRPASISKRVARTILQFTPLEATRKMLQALLPEGADEETFLLEILMAARGWAGLVAQLEKRKELLTFPRQILLLEYVALYLTLLENALTERGYNKEKINPTNSNSDFLKIARTVETEGEKILRLWHEAMEYSYYEKVFCALDTKMREPRLRSARCDNAEFQALYCIDDRMPSLMRHLEELSERIENFATPGYFGIDMLFQDTAAKKISKQSPASVEAHHHVVGTLAKKQRFEKAHAEILFWHRYANGLLGGWFTSLFLGLFSALRLIFSVHSPRKSYATICPVSEDAHEIRLSHDYALNEMVERVENVLREIGLVEKFAPLVAVVGHGASSTNNPYFAAYDCGACSGRPGLVNARVFAQMANDAGVRTALLKKGISIPQATWFVPALFDTSRDEITFFDDSSASHENRARLTKLKSLYIEALARDALERCRRFAFRPFFKSAKKAHKEVERRTGMLFEPRPEYNHANNALAIVARRSLTENVFLDRRVFLNSYDPTTDKEGEILGRILNSIVPVCAGINLEYFFSRIDNTVFGAGSKLAHNVFGLLGVANGAQSDLRTGLPEQMVEIHDPLRLLVLVETTREILLRVLEKNNALRNSFSKGWAHLALFDLDSNEWYLFKNAKFELIKLPDSKTPRSRDSLDVIRGQRETIPPTLLGEDAACP